jgi:hypothetical protein
MTSRCLTTSAARRIEADQRRQSCCPWSRGCSGKTPSVTKWHYAPAADAAVHESLAHVNSVHAHQPTFLYGRRAKHRVNQAAQYENHRGSKGAGV